MCVIGAFQGKFGGDTVSRRGIAKIVTQLQYRAEYQRSAQNAEVQL